jgi:periplasmic divalent cation tolerance protein
MSGVMVVFCTCGDREEAERIARDLVESQLAACVNILPSIQSIYRWQGQVEAAQEILLFVKTTAKRFPELQRRIIHLHSYETPEIIALPVSAGLDKYLAWVEESVQKPA